MAIILTGSPITAGNGSGTAAGILTGNCVCGIVGKAHGQAKIRTTGMTCNQDAHKNFSAATSIIILITPLPIIFCR